MTSKWTKSTGERLTSVENSPERRPTYMRFIKQPRHVSLYALKRDRPFISMHKPLIHKKMSSTQKHNFKLFLPIPRTDYLKLSFNQNPGNTELQCPMTTQRQNFITSPNISRIDHLKRNCSKKAENFELQCPQHKGIISCCPFPNQELTT